MNSEFVMHNWGPVTAAVLLLTVILYAFFQNLQRSPSSQLRRAVAEMRNQLRVTRKAKITADKAELRMDRLLQKAEKIRPSKLQEAKESLQDSRALRKIAEDKLMIAENHVRRIIHEEFPPVRQEQLRARYLPGGVRDRRPFSF